MDQEAGGSRGAELRDDQVHGTTVSKGGREGPSIEEANDVGGGTGVVHEGNGERTRGCEERMVVNEARETVSLRAVRERRRGSRILDRRSNSRRDKPKGVGLTGAGRAALAGGGFGGAKARTDRGRRG